jgi:hypothetical protein
MNSFVVGLDLGEKENHATYMSPDIEIKEGFRFLINREGCYGSRFVQTT